jgi:adenine-specific DNA-methyltransferase
LSTPEYEPAIREKGLSVYLGDSLDIMRRMPAESVDLCVTSPPYNIGKEYEKPLPLSQYVSWVEDWATEVARLLKPGGVFWLNLGYVPIEDVGKAVPLAYLLWDKVPLYFVQEVVWHYGAGVATKKSFSPRNEKFLYYVKDSKSHTFNLDAVRDPNVKYPNQKKNGKLRCNPLGKNPSDVWIFPKVTSGRNRSSKERTKHPAQFPEAVIERIIKCSSNKGDVVMDPFIGSGTTGIVAVAHDRECIGMELREDYIDIIRERYRNAFGQMALI